MMLHRPRRFTNTDLWRCAEREGNMRRRVYPNRVLTHRMTQAQADREVDMMAEISDVFREMAESDRLL
jgi:hypothetical protein